MEITDFAMPLTGKLMSIEQVPDEVFSTKAMGDGFAIELAGNDVLAPMEGTVDSIYPTGHAVMLRLDCGINVMVHVGLDSYKIAGLNKILVQAGDHVKQGQPLVHTDCRKMKAKAASVISPIVFLGGEKVTLLAAVGSEVKAGEMGIVSISR